MLFAAERLEPRRLLAAGDLDPAFGAGGVLDIDLTHPLLGVQRVVPINDGTGHMLVIGQEIRRFRPNGRLELTFGGGDGVIELPQEMIDANNYLENAAVLPTGKVIAVVRQQQPGDVTIHQIFAFNADGTPAGSSLPLGLGEVDQFVVQPDGKVLAVGASQVIRFTPDLEVDLTFGVNGVTSQVLSGSAMDVAGDGSFFAVGMNHAVPPQRAIVKFTAGGQLDASFGNAGEVIVADATTDPVGELEVNGDGSLLTVINGQIRRLLPSGEFDSTFGAGGAANTTFGDIAPATPELTLVPGGKILVVKGAGVTRLNGDGTIDPVYGRTVVSQSGAGLPASNQWGEVYFTAAGTTRTLALHRLAADNPTPGPIHLDENGQLFCVGTDFADEMRASDQNGDLVIMRNRFDVSRVFAPADITLLNFAGLGGNDFITLASAGWFRTTVSGGDGNDKILGCNGPDSIGGNAGGDFIAGGSGADRLAGHGGRDKLIGEGGADRCYGGPSADWLFGNGGNDQLYGDGGNDQIYGGSGNDTLDGAKGNDFMVSNDAAIEPPGWVDHIWGDGDWDTAVADPIDILVSIETQLDALPV
jgi:Ca2+-binding RTX toxin-like protein